jgi:hypothetical protein
MNEDELLKRTFEHTQEIEVPISKLYLDPNNPRFISKRPPIPPERYLEDQVITKTLDLMLDKPKDNFKIDEMMGDFLAKGFIDGDEIIVQKINGYDGYIVHEGNRRVTAIKQLLSQQDVTEEKRPGLCEELSVLPVTELLQNDLTDEEYGKLLGHMLGVRHLGQLKKWSPFARGNLLYDAYLKLTPKMTKESFVWEKNESGKCERGITIAKQFLLQLGSNLSPKTDSTRNILQTIRVMEQLKEVEGATIKPHYYSLLNELCVADPESELRKYLPIDEKTFLLTSDAVDRVINLCALLSESREGAPINKPQQWRFLSKILNKDENIPEDIESMLNDVMEKKDTPEDVWRKKEAERRTYSWKDWLDELVSLVSAAKVEDVLIDNLNTKMVIGRLLEVVDRLKEKSSGGEA